MINDGCQKEVDDARPACEAALKALATVDRESLQEISKSTNPPEMMKLTMEAVCIMLGAEPGDECYQEKRLRERERGSERERERESDTKRERSKERETEIERQIDGERRKKGREAEAGRKREREIDTHSFSLLLTQFSLTVSILTNFYSSFRLNLFRVERSDEIGFTRNLRGTAHSL